MAPTLTAILLVLKLRLVEVFVLARYTDAVIHAVTQRKIMEQSHLLSLLLATPVLVALIIALLPEKSARPVALLGGVAMLAISFWAGLLNPLRAMMGMTPMPGLFDWSNNGAMQLIYMKEWVQSPFPLNYSVGVDGMSMSLVLLTTIVTTLALVASRWITMREKLYYALVMLLTASILGVFTAQDLLQFLSLLNSNSFLCTS